MDKNFFPSKVLILVGLLAGFPAARATGTDADLSYVQNSLMSAAVQSSQYGTVTATSVSNGPVLTLQTTGGNPNQSSASSAETMGGIGSAKSSGDSATGLLRAYSQELGTTGSSAAAGSGVWDTLTFSGANVSATGTLTLTISGTFTDVGYGAADAVVSIPSTFAFSSPSTWTVLNKSNTSQILSVPFTITNGVPIEVGAELYTAAYNSFNIATADLYDPPVLSLQLPTGVTYTSASNVFLTSAVPEPETYVTLMAGLAMVGVVALRRKTI
jgi:PEP-CTERM motif